MDQWDTPKWAEYWKARTQFEAADKNRQLVWHNLMAQLQAQGKNPDDAVALPEYEVASDTCERLHRKMLREQRKVATG